MCIIDERWRDSRVCVLETSGGETPGYVYYRLNGGETPWLLNTWIIFYCTLHI